MFRVGTTCKHESRVAVTTTFTNIPPPPKFAVRKEHKPVQVGQESRQAKKYVKYV